ncbi:MAG: hypothetical protein ABJN84_08420 [Flavobacteriaceae bacterium]
MKTKIKIAVIVLIGMNVSIKAQEKFDSVELFGNNPTPSVNGFLNKLEFTGGSHGAIVFHPGGLDELMFGMHNNGNFYWGTGRSANQPDHYSMVLNGSTGQLTPYSLSLKGNNPTPSVNGFGNKLEFTGGSHGAIVFHPGGLDELMFGMHNNGNFYWGTGRSASNPDYYSMYLNSNNGNLGIRGKLTSNEVKVKLGGWSDFVFFDDYQLPTLQEVEDHIKEKGHLKDIPTAREVKENGIFLGEMDAKLLQKIEELTLYTIQQQKEIERLKSVEERLLKIEKLLESKAVYNKPLK